MVTYEERKILIDGKPVCLISGEIHYFRIAREKWQSVLDEAKELGLNCIASYVPWILHEEEEGVFDFEGQLDLAAFIDLCKENGLYFFLRPGPFIMAEMKNEGIPYWVHEKYPEAIPVVYEGKVANTTTLEYLNKDYLQACRRWYHKIFEVVRGRYQPEGGNIIGVQLDNEVGMLNWVTNNPVLNQNVIDRFAGYLKETYSEEELKTRYPFPVSPEAAENFRKPEPEWEVAFHHDWNLYMRSYYKEYLLTLKEYAIEEGVKDVPFFVNIHGTGSGRIYDFPLGVSQLYEAYNEGDCISGSDVYLGEPTIGNYQDTYVCNAYVAASNKKEQPLTSIEFECADGPYCTSNVNRCHPSGTQQRMLMHLAQDGRMINFYMFCGGVNEFLKHPRKDGNERMAFTNTYHGYAAPIEPDGHRNYSFDTMSDTARAVMALNEEISGYEQHRDQVALGVIYDYFLTETIYAKSEKAWEIMENLRKFRCAGQIDGMVRAMLNENINFTAKDIQADELSDVPNLVVLSARYMAEEVQQKLKKYVEDGGHLFLYGEVPYLDMEGNDCTVLKDALQLETPVYLKSALPIYLTVSEVSGEIGDYVVDDAQCFAKDDSAILTIFGEDLMCGFEKSVGSGQVTAITCAYPCEMKFYKRLFEKAGITPAIQTEYYRYGNFASLSEGKDGGELIYLCNLDAMKKEVCLKVKGEVLFENFRLNPKEGLILPKNISRHGVTIKESTAQVMKWNENEISFRLTQPEDRIVIAGDREVVPQGEVKTICENGMITFCPDERNFFERQFTVVVK